MPSSSFADALLQFGDTRGYLAAASIGVPPRAAVEALRADLDAWFAAQRDPQGYDGVVERTRASYAALVGVAAERVAVGSQTSVLTSLIAASVPPGAEVLCVDGDFSSMVFPFLARGDLRVRHVPIARLAESITDETWLVPFSLVQSSNGVIADSGAIVEAAASHGALTYCDVTQAAGVHPVDAAQFDATVGHAYKWLCAPRGVAFLTISERMQALVRPIQAGWYAGDSVWTSVYGPAMELAQDARRFDVSPAWQAWVGPSSRSRCSPGSTSRRSGITHPRSAISSVIGSASRRRTRPSSPGQTPPAQIWGSFPRRESVRRAEPGGCVPPFTSGTPNRMSTT